MVERYLGDHLELNPYFRKGKSGEVSVLLKANKQQKRNFN